MKISPSGPLTALAFSAALIVLVTACSEPPHGPAAAAKADSVLLITIDTIRADRIGAYGAAQAETPNLDRLARAGILYENAYAVAPLTLPAHASLLTGAYPPEHGVRNNGIHALAEDWETLPEILTAEGVRTAAVVAATVLDRRYGLAQGFEVYDDEMRAERSSSLAAAAAVERPAGAVTEAAMGWLNGLGGDERFFLWVHYFDPHAPYAPPEPYRDRFDEPYDGEIAYVDSEIGRLLRHPRLAGDDRLAVVVIGDHGESLGEHGEMTHGMLTYDATLRIPWIVKPAGGPRGERRQRRIDQVDLFPTVLAMMGFRPPDPGKGRDLLAASDAAAADNDEPRPLYAETWVPFYTYGWAKLRTLRVGSMKYIDAPAPELYDLERDPDESANLIASERRTAAELKRELERLFRAEGSGEAAAVAPDRETRSRLRALGYLGALRDGAGGGEAGDPKELMAVHVAIEEANRRLLAGDSAAAIEGYRQALAEDPSNLRALSDLATAQAAGGRLEEGVRTLEKAVGLAPENAQLHLQRAAFAEEQGDAVVALAHLDLAIELAPALLEARLEKASYLGKLGRTEEAAASIGETIERYPDDAEANVLYAQLVEVPLGDLDAAESRLRRAAARDPHLDSARRALAAVLERRGETAAARQMLRQTKGDDAPDILQRRAVEAFQRGDSDAAVATLERVVSQHPGYAPAWVNLSWIALEGEEWESAARNAQRALDLDPTLVQAWENLGRAREAQGSIADAEEAYRKAVENDVNGWQTRLRLSWLLFQLGQQAEASDLLSWVEERAASDAEARLQLGRIYEARGEGERARLHYQAVVRLAPGGPLGVAARDRLRGGF